MRTITGENIDKMLKKFQRGWIPEEDGDWKDWAESTKEELSISNREI